MPEEQSANLIGSRLHIKYDAHALLFSGIGLFQFQYDGAGKVLIPKILGFIILTDIYHAPQVLDQAPVRIVCRRLVKEPAAIRIGIQNDLDRVDHRRLAASGMAGKEINPFA